MGRILAGAAAPDTLTLALTCPPLPEGGDAAIGGWLDRNPNARMVVVDVLAKVRGQDASGNRYDADYAAVSRVKKLADHYGVAMVLVHHVRKAASEDFLTEVSGTNGLAGAADATLVFKRARTQDTGVLSITGRDVEEAEHAMSFDADRRTWALLDGPASDHTVGDTRAAILRYLREHPGTGPKNIAAGAGIGYDIAKKTCQRMADAGQITSDGNGRYAVPTDTGSNGVPAVPGVPDDLLNQVNTDQTGGQSATRIVPGTSSFNRGESPQ